MHRLYMALCLAVIAFAAACDQTSGSSHATQPNNSVPPAQTYNPAAIPLMILDSTLPVAFTGQAYSHQLTAIGGSGVYYWSLSGAGASMLSISTSGLVTVPVIPSTTLGTSVMFQVQDSVGRTASRNINFHANYSYNHPNPGVRGRVNVLHTGEQTSYMQPGDYFSRFQRSVQLLMQDIAGLIWDPVETNTYDQFVIVIAGHGTAALESPNIRTAQVAEKVAAINALAALTPGGDAPMYAAMQLAETAAGSFFHCDVVALYSGGSFGADPAAPGGQASFASVLAQAGGWTGNVSATWAVDFAPAGAHEQFMQDFAALTVGGMYLAP